MKTRLSMLLYLSLALVAAPALADQPGRIDLAPLAASIDATPKVNINFGPAMLAGFAETLRPGNPELADVLQSVKGLRLMVYEDVDSTAGGVEIADIIARLQADGWSPTLTVRDSHTEVDLFLLESGQFVKGLTLLLRDGRNTAVFINIHGDLDPLTIGQLIGSGQAMSGVDFGDLMGQFQGGGNGD